MQCSGGYSDCVNCESSRPNTLELLANPTLRKKAEELGFNLPDPVASKLPTLFIVVLLPVEEICHIVL
jgi:hypothetical protein